MAYSGPHSTCDVYKICKSCLPVSRVGKCHEGSWWESNPRWASGHDQHFWWWWNWSYWVHRVSLLDGNKGFCFEIAKQCFWYKWFKFQMKEREHEEVEEFIPFCFKAFADNVGKNLKVWLKSILESLPIMEQTYFGITSTCNELCSMHSCQPYYVLDQLNLLEMMSFEILKICQITFTYLVASLDVLEILRYKC